VVLARADAHDHDGIGGKMTVLAKPLSRIQSLIAPDEETRQRRALEKKLRSEAEWYADKIRKRLTRLGICYRYPKSRKDIWDQAVQKIKFTQAVGTPEAIYLMIDTLRLPRKVSIADIDDDEVLDDLSLVCRRPVRFRYKTRCGAWFIIERESGVWGIPRKLKFQDVLENWPDSSRKKLLVPLGVGENRRLIYRSLARLPHALVGGSTGSGKTTFLHAWICALILKNSPEDLQLGLVDLKGGVEFTRYKGLEHVMSAEMIGDEDLPQGGFIKRPEDVEPLLRYMRNEMDRRLHRFEHAGGIQNLRIWNYRRRAHKLPRLVLFVDEIATLMLDRKHKNDVEPLLSDIAARGRAPGVHIVIATQRPTSKVLTGLIKGNIDARFAFRVPDNPSSMIILDTTEAAKFGDDTPQGRYIYRRGLDKVEVQAPLITHGQIKQVVSDVAAGRGEEEATGRMPPEDIFRFAIEQMGGDFSVRGLYDALGGRAAHNYIARLGKEYEGEVIEIDDSLYELKPAAGPKPRHLEPVGMDGQEDDRDV
jgi:hypothetical protein